MANTNTKRLKRKKVKKNIPVGIAHISASFNNTIINITDLDGNTVALVSSGLLKFKGRRQATSFAAQQVAKKVAALAKEKGMQQIEVEVKGPGIGRDTSIRFLQESGLIITSIRDVTTVPHNGCRPPQRPRG